MVTSSVDVGQIPLEIVQRSMLFPTESPVIPVVPEDAFANVAVPETTLQSPVPMLGEFP